MNDVHMRVPWTLRDILYASLAALLLILCGVVLVAALLMIAGRGGAGMMPTSSGITLVFGLEAILIVPAWLWGAGKYRVGWHSLGFRRFRWLRAIALCIVALGLILGVDGLWELLRRRMNWPGQPDYLPFFGKGVQALLVALLLGGVVAPIAEEVFFRGFVYAGLRSRWGVVWGLILSATAFALAHVVPSILVPILIMGLVFGLLYELTGSLWPCIALHSAVNSLAFLAAYITRYHPDLFART